MNFRDPTEVLTWRLESKLPGDAIEWNQFRFFCDTHCRRLPSVSLLARGLRGAIACAFAASTRSRAILRLASMRAINSRALKGLTSERPRRPFLNAALFARPRR